MPKRKIIFQNNQYYHVYNRGVNKADILYHKHDINRFLESLSVFNTTESIGSIYENRFNNQLGTRGSKLVEIIAFNILDNHYHLILKQLVDGGISKFMNSIGGGYTKHINKKYDRVGSLFQGPFKAEYINSDGYFNYVVTYVNGNHLIHGFEEIGTRGSKWGARSSLEQYVNLKNEWKNKYFECDMSMVKDNFFDNVNYLKEVGEIAKNIVEKRTNNLEPRVPSQNML